MATVAELVPGDLVTNGPMSAVFLSRGAHPLWPDLMLVTWRLRGELGYSGWSFDALSLHQEVGDVTPSMYLERRVRLREILLGEGQ